MDIINHKLEIAKRLVVEEFGDAVAAIIVMGSIINEANETSDLDVSVIYHDLIYNEQIEEFRDKLNEIAEKINHEQPHHPIILWASKKDHYLTNLPDISYVKRNLPYAFDRLDAWGGLAKNTLASYEIASHKILYGQCDALLIDKIIPPYEAVELFLIATRTFAEGIIKLSSIDILEQRNGSNYIAKAGLRAAYAVLISKNKKSLNSYREILNAAILSFPQDLHPVLKYLYEVKTATSERSNIVADFLPEIFKLLHYCENQVSTVRRLSIRGMAIGRRGEELLAFANFSEASKNNPPAQSEDYCRCPGFDVNYIHSLYFLITAFEIVRRFISGGIDDPTLINFFFEEIFVVATFVLCFPFGLKIQLGKHLEMICLQISISLEEKIETILQEREKVFLYILSIEKFHEALAQYNDKSWFSSNHLVSTLRGLVICVSIAIAADNNTLNTLPGNDLLNDDHIILLKWQSRLLRQIYNEKTLEAFNESALMLFHIKERKDDAKAVLQELLWLDNENLNPYNISQKAIRLLSRTRQYLGIIYHHSGDTRQAKREYARALELDPDNFSALDDYTSLLMLTEPTETTVKLLSEILERTVNHRKESQKQVSQRFILYAIKCKDGGNYSNAKIWCKHAINLDPNSFRAHFEYGLLLEQSGDVLLAEKNYKKAINLNGQYKKAYVKLALLHENQGNIKSSINLLNSVVKSGFADEQVWTNLGNSYLKKNNLKYADKSFVKALEINNDYTDAWNGRGCVLMSKVNPSLQDLALALFFFQKAIELEPSFDGAKMNLMIVLLKMKTLQKDIYL
jgi:tetratricopeptide (TPR) repeat protein